MIIRQAMTAEVCVATPDETIQKAAQLMLGLDIGMFRLLTKTGWWA